MSIKPGTPFEVIRTNAAPEQWLSQTEAVKQLVAELTDQIAQLLDVRLRTCCNCMFFRERNETCSKTNPPARPPASIIVKGCEMWAEDDIPF